MIAATVYQPTVQYIGADGLIHNIIDDGGWYSVKFYESPEAARQACIDHAMKIARGEIDIKAKYDFIVTVAGVGIMTLETAGKGLGATREEVIEFLKREGYYNEKTVIDMQEQRAVVTNGNFVYVVYRFLKDLKIVHMRFG